MAVEDTQFWMEAMSKKKRNKKHNQVKRARRFFSNVRIWSWESTVVTDGARYAHGECKAGFVWRDLDQKTVNAIVKRNHNWVVCCRALCMSGGKTWVESEIRSARDIKVNELSDEFEKLRKEVLDAQRLDHVIDVGWIVQTFGEKDRIDDLIECAHLGPITKERAEAWAESNKTYETRDSRVDLGREAA